MAPASNTSMLYIARQPEMESKHADAIKKNLWLFKLLLRQR